MADTKEVSDRIQLALNEQRLWDGRLDHIEPGAHASTSHRYVVSSIAPSVLEHFQRQRASIVMTSDAIGIGPRFTYWVLGLRAGEIEHRFFLPLVAPSVWSLLNDVRREDLHLLMDAGPAVPALSAGVPVTRSLRNTLVKLHRPDFDRNEALRDVVLTAANLLLPDGLKPVNPGVSPSSVSVTAVLPPELVAPDEGLFGA